MKLSAEEIEKYCLIYSNHPSPLSEELMKFTRDNFPDRANMMIGPMVISFVGFLISALGVKKILEIGTFTGYSALGMAERLPADGTILTLDINPETTEVAKKFWARSPAGKKIESRLGAATDLLPNVNGAFDLILIDADKANYKNYFERSLELMSPRGVLIFDNCLWSGKVLDASQTDPDTSALRELAKIFASRNDLEKVLIPLRDGLFLVRKK